MSDVAEAVRKPTTALGHKQTSGKKGASDASPCGRERKVPYKVV
jgi:hypothetical protein